MSHTRIALIAALAVTGYFLVVPSAWAGFRRVAGRRPTTVLWVRFDAATRPEIVCLCGSTRFVPIFNQVRRDLARQGVIVLSIDIVEPQTAGDDPQHADPAVKATLDRLHARQIDLADRVLVVSDESGYFGKSTRGEIAYALAHHVPVDYLVPAP